MQKKGSKGQAAWLLHGMDKTTQNKGATREAGYNGWTNYETWLVKLWIDNEESSYNYWSEEAQRVYDNAEASETFSRIEQAALTTY